MAFPTDERPPAARSMAIFKLNNGVEVIPTSFHGSRFNDGTNFSPTPEQIADIKQDWSVLTVERKFEKVELPIKGVGCSKSTQRITADGLSKLDVVLANYPNAIILVSFMVVSALHEMGIRDRYPRVLATNATAETSRSKPEEKIWDVGNFAY